MVSFHLILSMISLLFILVGAFTLVSRRLRGTTESRRARIAEIVVFSIFFEFVSVLSLIIRNEDTHPDNAVYWPVLLGESLVILGLIWAIQSYRPEAVSGGVSKDR